MTAPIAGPFYFAWIDPTETTFGVEHHRMDEYIFSTRRVLAEGEKPLLELVIENPHEGLLNTDRKQWAWFGWHNGTSIIPLFIGRVVGTPTAVFEETLTVQFVTWPIDYVQRLQRAAEPLKVRPHYDEVFIEASKRDDPDTILEANTKVWHVDPVTMAVTASDWINGDSNADFTEDDHFYDSMNMTVGSPPKTAILMDASVSWTQTARGTVDVGNRSYETYAGDGIISEWPKPLQSLGSGWSVSGSNAVDAGGTETALVATFQWSWTNTAKTHNDGDSLSITVNQSVPMVGGITGVITQKSQSGVLDPFAVDGDGDPAPLNIPASSESTTVTVPLWRVNTSLILQYVAERKRTERVIFMLQSDLQPVIVDPTLAQDSETITRSGADVGVPILRLLNSTTVRGTVVSVGDVIFPDNPALPGGRAAQRCTVGGLTGVTEPVFSDVVGTVTVDGAAHWASLGVTSPSDNATDWTAVSSVPTGAMILPRQPFFIPWRTFIQPALVKVGQSGVSASLGTIVQASNGSYQVCTEGGQTLRTEPAFSTTWGVVVSDGAAQWTSLGMTLPSGTTYFIATQGGVTGSQYVIPPFNDALHATTGDGTVVWTSVGTGVIPVGGVPGNVTASQYFSTDRGRQSIEYLASILRSHLLWSARCVTITFDCDWLRGSQLSTRMTATLHDPRIAGGIALGKIKTVEMVMDQTGAAVCHVTIACCVGKGTAITEVPGDAEYVDDDYVEDEYQVHDGVVTLVPSLSDMAYSPPATSATDDGLTFPLTLGRVLVSDEVRGDLSAQEAGIRSALASMAQAARITQFPPGSLDDSVRQQRQAELARANSVPFQLQQHPIWQDWVFRPVNAGPFNAVYNVKFARLVVPKDVDLLSESSTT